MLGVTEYLFRKPLLLEEVIATAIEDDTFRSDDLEFTFAARVSMLPSRGNYVPLLLSPMAGPDAAHERRMLLPVL